MESLLETYNEIRECHYKNERYSVRDNGAVLRHASISNRKRPTDNKWTFGKLNKRTHYLEIASVRIHRIVATAFHGEPPTDQHVVDHRDTNKQNNRPENLRWVTRLENILLNPITSRRIELVCGSVEAFLSNPSKYREQLQNSNYEWMSTVSQVDAQICYERLLAWSKSDKPLKGGTLGEWIFNRNVTNEYDEDLIEKIEFIDSLTPNAVQIFENWKTPSEFPLSPQKNFTNPIIKYFENLSKGKVFSRNQYTSSIVEEFAISKNKEVLWIMCKSGDEYPIKPFSLAEVTYHNKFYIHNSLGTFFEKAGVQKQFTLKQGLEWTGGDSIDDYC